MNAPSQIFQPRVLAALQPDTRTPGMMMNAGIWSSRLREREAFILANRAIKYRTRELHVLKCLFAQAFYSEDAFCRICDKTWYDDLRWQCHASSLLDLYQKVSFDKSDWVVRTSFHGRSTGTIGSCSSGQLGRNVAFHAFLRENCLSR